MGDGRLEEFLTPHLLARTYDLYFNGCESLDRKGSREGGVNPPLPRNCEGNENHTKTGTRGWVIGDRQKYFFPIT